MVEMAVFNLQRAITPKVGKPELRLMCSAHRLIVLYICVKFGENISDGIRVMERTRMTEALKDRRTLKISNGITKYSRHFLWRGIRTHKIFSSFFYYLFIFFFFLILKMYPTFWCLFSGYLYPIWRLLNYFLCWCLLQLCWCNICLLTAFSVPNLVLCLQKLVCLTCRFVPVIQQYLFSDAGGAVAIFRDEFLVLNKVDKARSC